MNPKSLSDFGVQYMKFMPKLQVKYHQGRVNCFLSRIERDSSSSCFGGLAEHPIIYPLFLLIYRH